MREKIPEGGEKLYIESVIQEMIKDEGKVLNAMDKLKIIKEINEIILGIHPEYKLSRGEIIMSGRQTLHPMLIGDSGVGKSTRVLQAFKYEKVRTIILTQMLPEDIGGIPRVIPVGKDKYKTVFVLPEDILEYDIIFFDEVDKARSTKLAPILSILSERRLRGVDLWEKFFVFGGQPDFLRRLNQDDTLRALSQRLIFIPCYYEEAIKYIERVEGIPLSPIISEEIPPYEKQMQDFELIYRSPRYLHYVIVFIKLLRDILTKKFSELKTDDMIKIAHRIVTGKIRVKVETEEGEKETAIKYGIFYYLPERLCNYLIQNIFKETIPTIAGEILKMYENPEYALHNIPPLQSLMKAVDFYGFLAGFYDVVDVEARREFFEKLYKNVEQTQNFLADDFKEVALCHLATGLLLLKDTNAEARDLYQIYLKYFPEKAKEMAEKINRVYKSWGIKKKITP